MINLIGQNLQNGKYLIERELGRGNFGITYKATNLALERDVAIKMLDSHLRQDSNLNDWVAQFQDEARRLAKCSHPNIVPVLDFFCEGERPCIVMEYIRGQTLDLIVRNKNPLPEAKAVEYIKQTGAALSAIHQQFLLHQDVKPKNLILSRDSQQVVLIDFGIAREFSAQQLQNQAQNQRNLLSEGYAPLEQYIVDSPRTIATDIYGLAATLYTLLTGKIPLSAISRVHGCTLDSPRKIRPELSDTVSEAVMWGMALETDCRPGSLSEWLAKLTSNTNEISSLVTSTSLQVTNSLLNLPITTKSLNQGIRKKTLKTPINWATNLSKIAVLVGTILGLGTAILFASSTSNSNFQTKQTTDKDSSTAGDSSSFPPQSFQSPSVKNTEQISDPKKSVNLESSSSQQASDRNQPATNFDVQQSTLKIDGDRKSQSKAKVNVPSKPVIPASKAVDSSDTPQLFLPTKTPTRTRPQSAIFGSSYTKSANQRENKPRPQIFSNSPSEPRIKRQPQILLNRGKGKKIRNIRRNIR
ncbi:protein kinase [Pleurocapsa sp. PCC 7319]|uniref:protein kinase domain-containing protein n=1 Tax=Pleurocapsa sp. PCC 7319 TaxID=118161 RepID=UPI00034C7FB5|nr:protein kinase [Pleurocapsa sp. PCC 7319]